LKLPAAAIEEVWWRIPASMALARSTAFCVPVTLSVSFVSSSAVMS
jgi:hypothetical protein